MSRQYGRDEVEYATWYSVWSKRLAKTKTLEQLQSDLGRVLYRSKGDTMSHLRAIEKTGSMKANSSQRAKTRNVVEGNCDLRMALEGAIEIYELFPEEAMDYQIGPCSMYGEV